MKNYEKLFFRYALENLKFGKVDVGRYPDAAAKYHISDASTSKQLPTLIFFKDGKEVERRPYASNKGKLVKFLFSLVCVTLNINIHFLHNLMFLFILIFYVSIFQDNVKAAFDLNNIYNNCKKNPIKRKEKKKAE